MSGKISIPPTQKVEPLVRYFMRTDPRTREAGKGGDKVLIWRCYDAILTKYGVGLSNRQLNILIHKAPAHESIRRCRQRIQELAEKGGASHKDFELLPKDGRASAHSAAEKWRKDAREGKLTSGLGEKAQ